MNRIFRTVAGPLALCAWIGLACAQDTLPPINPPRGEAADRAARLPATSAVDPLDQAIEMTTSEIALGKVAVMKAQNTKVKNFATMMVKDHTTALAKLQAIQGVSPVEGKPDPKPSEAQQSTSERLSNLSGAEFDREYMRTMVFSHQQALEFFEMQSKVMSTNANAPAGKKTLAQVSMELIPMVRGHLEDAQSIQSELSVK